MKVLSFLCFVLFLATFSTPGEAQFLKRLSDGLEKATQELEAGLEDVDGSGPKDLSASCDLLENNETVLAYTSKVKQILALNEEAKRDEFFLDKFISFDTDDFLLYKWIYDNQPINGQYGEYATLLNFCAYRFARTDLQLMFLSGGGGLDYLGNRMSRIQEKIPKPERALDRDGNLVETTPEVDWDSVEVFTGINNGSSSNRERNGSYHPVLPGALLLGGGETVTTIGGIVLPQLDAMIDELEAEIRQKKDTRQAQQRRRADAESARVQRERDLIAGKLDVKSMADARVKWQASHGSSIIARPPIEADGKNYDFFGTLIDVQDGLGGKKTLTLSIETSDSARHFAFVRLDSETIISGQLRINSSVGIVGRFDAVQKRETTLSTTVFVPVFSAYFVGN